MYLILDHIQPLGFCVIHRLMKYWRIIFTRRIRTRKFVTWWMKKWTKACHALGMPRRQWKCLTHIFSHCQMDQVTKC